MATTQNTLDAHEAEAVGLGDRFLLAAVVDRLIFGAETTFRTADALALSQLLPREARAGLVNRFFSLGLDASISSGSARGHAAGIGSPRRAMEAALGRSAHRD